MPSPTRRTILTTGATVVTAAAAPTWLSSTWAKKPQLRPTPGQSEGPFYPVVMPADSDFDLLRNGPAQYKRGQPCWIEGTVVDVNGVPVTGAVVEIWQCDQAGHYHHPGDGSQADPAFQGFGRAAVGPNGHYRFRTLRPAPYSGRTPHIHLKVRRDLRVLLTTQLYVTGDSGNERDLLWQRLNEQDRAALTVPFTLGVNGLRAHFPIVVQV